MLQFCQTHISTMVIKTLPATSNTSHHSSASQPNGYGVLPSSQYPQGRLSTLEVSSQYASKWNQSITSPQSEHLAVPSEQHESSNNKPRYKFQNHAPYGNWGRYLWVLPRATGLPLYGAILSVFVMQFGFVEALPSFLDPIRGTTPAEEMLCYGIPYGGIGFASHIITYYTLICL